MGKGNRSGGKHQAETPDQRTPGERLKGIWTERPRPTHLLVMFLCLVLGFALSAQIRSHNADHLARLSEPELVSILNDLEEREDQLRAARSELREQVTELEDAATSAEAASEAAQKALTDAEITAGAIPVHGPGVVYRVSAEQGTLPASLFVTTLAELRNAGAEAIEMNGIRISGRSWFGSAGTQIVLDGTAVSPPYIWRAIGDPHTLSTALDIRGGASAQFRAYGADVSISEARVVDIDAVAAPTEPAWATVTESD